MSASAPFFPQIDFGVDDVPDFHARMAEPRDAGHRVVPVRYVDEERLPAAPAYRRHSEPVQPRSLRVAFDRVLPADRVRLRTRIGRE